MMSKQRGDLVMKIAPLMLCALMVLSGCGKEDSKNFFESGKAFFAKKEYISAVIEFKNAVQKDPDNAELRFLLGSALREAGDPASAEIEFRKAIAGKYDPEIAYPLLYRTLLDIGQGDKVIREARDVPVTKSLTKAELGALVGEAFLVEGKLKEARDAFSVALSKDRSSVPAQLGMAKMFAIDQRFEEASKIADEILAQDPNSADAVLIKADLLHDTGNVEASKGMYRKAIELRPLSGKAYFNLVPVLLRERDIEGASKLVAQLKKLSPRTPTAQYLDAVVAFAQNDKLRAREALRDVLKGSPEYGPALLLAGATEHDLGSYLQAEEYLRKVVKNAPNESYPRRLLVSTYVKSGQSAKAREALAPMLEKWPNEPSTYVVAGEVAVATQDMAKATEYFQKAVTLDPKNATSRTRLGQARLLSGDIQRAVQDLEDASTSDPNQFEADIALVTHYLKEKQLDKAALKVESLTKKQPNHPITHNLRGLVMLSKGDRAGGRASFEKALEVAPTYLPAAHNLASLDLQDRKIQEARKRYELVIEKDPKHEDANLTLLSLLQRTGAPASELERVIDKWIGANPSSSAARLTKVNYLVQMGDKARALDAAKQAQAALPNDLQVLEATGRAQIAAGEYDQAISSFGKLATQSPKNTGPWVAQAEAFIGSKDWSGARSAFRKALDIQPDLILVRQGLVQVAIRAEKYDEALSEAQAIKTRWPKTGIGYTAEADVYAAQKKYPEAEKILREAPKDLTDPAATLRLHGLLLEQQKTKEADDVVMQWVAAHPNDMRVPIYLAEASGGKKDYASAAKWYKLALKTQPKNLAFMNNYAWVLGQLKDPSAIEVAEKALASAPNSPPVLDTVGWIYSENGNSKKGLELLGKASELAPNSGPIRLNYARALIKAGDKKAARDQLEQIQNLPISGGARKEAEELIKAL